MLELQVCVRTTYTLLEGLELGGSKGVRLANDGDDIDAGREAAHELNVHLAEGVAGRGDKVEESVDTVVAEAGVTLDTRLLGENVVVLTLEVGRDLLEAGVSFEQSVASLPVLVVNAVAKAGGVDDSKGDANTVLLKLNVDGLDLDVPLSVSVGGGLLGKNGVDLGTRVLGVAEELLWPVLEEGLLNKSVDKSGAASAGGA